MTAHAGKDHDQAYLTTHDIGTGRTPCRRSWRGDHYTLTSFANYWGPKPSYSTVDIKITPDMNSQIWR